VKGTELEPRHCDYIDALRGYAILMVIAVHSSQYFSDLSPIARAFADQGARGVQLFFVASAMTLWMSWQSRNDGAPAFYIRRLFRIAPMFYLCLPLFLMLESHGPTTYAPEGVGVRQIIMAATFTHGFMPDAITSVVPGSWSIADEMIFYALFPILMAIRARFVVNVVVTVLATVGCLVVERYFVGTTSRIADPTWRACWATFYFLWFVNQFPCFLFGMLIARWIAEDRPIRWPVAVVVGSAVLAGLDVVFMPARFAVTLPVQYGAIFAIFALGLSKWQPILLVNPVICWIGKVSYSAYLIHFLLLSAAVSFPRQNFAIAYVSLAAITIGLSTISYLSIEKPFNRIGRQLARRLASKYPAAESA
jgi:exopolysaccharide production protein ExoZ